MIRCIVFLQNVCVRERESVRCIVGGTVTKSHYCNWKLKSHLFFPLVFTVSTKTGVLLLKLSSGISFKGHVREHKLIEKAATQAAEAGQIIYYRENVSHLLLRLSYLSYACPVQHMSFRCTLTLSPTSTQPPPLVKCVKALIHYWTWSIDLFCCPYFIY